MKKAMIELKAQLLCEGINPDDATIKHFQQQNPSGTKRGGLSSGGKFKLPGEVFVNAPFYTKRKCGLQMTMHPEKENLVLIKKGNTVICQAEVLLAPEWYQEKVGEFPITQILTAHNKQLTASVYEDCSLFAQRTECRFCVIKWSLKNRDPSLILKKADLLLTALEKIPVQNYGGLTLNGGMTSHPGRGMELIEPVVREIHAVYPDLPIAVEITPPEDLDWINRLAEVGVSSLMMNLETWDLDIRKELLPGKACLCPRYLYFQAFERAIDCLGEGKVSSCFVVGTEPIESLKQGIQQVIKHKVIPSPLAGRYFEDIPDYPFTPQINWRDFLDIFYFSKHQMTLIQSTDKAGCVACGMCDLIKEKAL